MPHSVHMSSSSLQRPSTVGCSWSGGKSGQSTNDGWSRHNSLPHWLLPAAPTTSHHLVTDADSRSDACLSLHHLLARFLQLVALRNCRQSTKATVYSSSRTRQHVWSLVRTSCQFCSHFTGYWFSNGFCSYSEYCSTCASMGMHLPTWQTTVAWSAATSPVLDRRRQRPNWRSHWPERRSATDLLLSIFTTHH